MFRHCIPFLQEHKGTQVIFCVRRIPEDDTPLSKHVGVILIMDCDVWSVYYCILLSALFGQCTETDTTVSAQHF
jgi:hypothetical protein